MLMLPGTDILIVAYSKSRALVESPVRAGSSTAWLLQKAVDIDSVSRMGSPSEVLFVVVTQNPVISLRRN